MKSKKGEYGYISAQKKKVILWTIVLFALSLTIFISGYLYFGTRKNLLTIVAVLGLLPACKSFVNMVMFFKAKGCTEQAFVEISKNAVAVKGLFDLYLTTYKVNYPISHMTLIGNDLVGLCEVENVDIKGAQEHLEEMLKQGGYKKVAVRIIAGVPAYLERLEQLEKLEHETHPCHDEILEMLLSISL